MEQGQRKSILRSAKPLSRTRSEEQPMLSDLGERREVVLNIDGNGNGNGPGADVVGAVAKPTASRTLSTATSSPAQGWADASFDFWRNERSPARRVDDFSFKNRPASPQPQASSPSISPKKKAVEAGEDPPTRLIGKFLRKQRASGAEPSLDLDLEMEEPRRPPQRTQRVSFEDEHQEHVSSDSDSDTGKVIRCKSTSTAAGPLLRTKTRSRLTEPPPPSAAAPVIDKKHRSSASRSPKPGQSPSWRWSSPMDGEEEDPFVHEDIPDDFHLKRGKLDALTILQWVSLLLITGALACSASIRILSKKVWELCLWKWELLMLALVCGRLVSGWVIRVAMLCFGRNLLLRKRVLYFVYGVRSAVQNTLWLGLVLASWHFLFDDKSQAGHMAVASYVMKILFCLLVATLIWFVKTLLLKVLASSFHVSTYFDRIQASLFNQYVTETLSGQQLVDDQGHAEVGDLHAAMPTKNLSLQRSIRTSVSMSKQQGQGGKQVSKEKRQHQIDEGISIDKLHKLNRRNVSAWNMKRLMKIIRFGTLTTIDEQIKQATGEGDLSATQIRSEYESQMAAKAWSARQAIVGLNQFHIYFYHVCLYL